jgi:hypothetical protein
MAAGGGGEEERGERGRAAGEGNEGVRVRGPQGVLGGGWVVGGSVCKTTSTIDFLFLA